MDVPSVVGKSVDSKRVNAFCVKKTPELIKKLGLVGATALYVMAVVTRAAGADVLEVPLPPSVVVNAALEDAGILNLHVQSREHQSSKVKRVKVRKKFNIFLRERYNKTIKTQTAG